MSFLDIAGKYANGMRILKDWLGDGGVPVDKALAQSRSDTCRTCSHNLPGWIPPEHVARAIKEQIELKNELKLHVENEDRLHTCGRCLCPLKLKPWVPLSYQTKYMTSDELQTFPEHCWLRREMNL